MWKVMNRLKEEELVNPQLRWIYSTTRWSEDLIADNSEIYNYQGVVNEDHNVANTPAPPEVQAPTPAILNQNDVADDDEEEPLNENDDDLDDVDKGDEVNTYHLTLAQFDKVTHTKSRWKCILKDDIMHINNKDVLFN
ncbi:transcription initiation factor IIA large subunit [Lactuca sativa]|uniref:Uncharacterized protein n=1 Tax=Lactuca sativa TaxID=4236 RepID=A0A9R1UUM4_LACSA|nr:transcription initiation factor IIA large subunit [Lactuca sativa]KAJ0193091.1 hypothetical protein LSAT_V11C800418210 [Lactuca sativa]